MFYNVNMKRIFILLLIMLISVRAVMAVEADDSIDEIIKKEYNTSSLPALPKTSPKSVESKTIFGSDKPTSSPVTNAAPSVPTVTKSAETNTPTIKSDLPTIPQKINVRTSKIGWGKKIPVKFNTNVSDRTRKGAKVSFITQAPVVSKYITLPTGTVIHGTVVNSHAPQILGNGGLIAVKADYITYNGRTSYCEGKLVDLNHKAVFFNKIKGDNGYFKGIQKVRQPAVTFYGKSMKVTKKLWNGPGAILTPVTYLPGALFLVCDTAVSPFIALFHKGDNVYVNKGTTATIKLTSPAYIEY